ncbi:hypothetical protein EDB92DRAFT_1814477 [Lactarius akahatsu]|uniref:Uncharacterized protein n=1 Tax=Lactarius akahatsu TaxID=416441 RepID=A0AAD4QFV3_9AGAM|nr:hypothetical protein EDB92DRAFT_1814477 [Lactarius akahatsu]
MQSACTSGNSETRYRLVGSAEGGSRCIPHLKCLRDSSSAPSMMTTSSFRVLQSAPNRAVGCRPSYSVLAMRSVRRHSGWLEPSAAARPGLLSSTARGNADEVGEHEVGNMCAGGHGEKVFEERPRDVCTCVGIVGGELERTVERELHGGAEALRDAGKLVQAITFGGGTSVSPMGVKHRSKGDHSPVQVEMDVEEIVDENKAGCEEEERVVGGNGEARLPKRSRFHTFYLSLSNCRKIW